MVRELLTGQPEVEPTPRNQLEFDFLNVAGFLVGQKGALVEGEFKLTLVDAHLPCVAGHLHLELSLEGLGVGEGGDLRALETERLKLGCRRKAGWINRGNWCGGALGKKVVVLDSVQAIGFSLESLLPSAGVAADSQADSTLGEKKIVGVEVDRIERPSTRRNAAQSLPAAERFGGEHRLFARQSETDLKFL